MFGYRLKELLALTRFYTTDRIHDNIVKITEIDIELRDDIEKGKLGNGLIKHERVLVGMFSLVEVDENGNLVLIEIKRDVEDIKQRKEAFEFQAIRYAASYAKIKTSDELVEKIFASYIEKYKDEFELGELTAYERATRILNDFLEKNNADKTFNSRQRIILIASSFDSQTLSAVAWLIANNIDISCFELSPMKIGDNYFIDINLLQDLIFQGWISYLNGGLLKQEILF